MTSAYIVLGAILAVCGAAMIWGLWEIWVYLVRAAGRLLWAFCCHMCRNPRRSPAPRHGPAAKALRSAPITLSDEDVADRWPDLEKRLADIPEPRNGGDR